LTIGFALPSVAGEAVERQPAERYLEDPVAAPEDAETALHALTGLELGLA
jgi:hypothetical protein